jgi:hypothetical protein
MEYYLMVILPRMGWRYADVKALTLKERTLLFTMLDIEARAMPRPPRP